MIKKILFFDCFSGISGDMTVGALLDLGADRELLTKSLSGLPVDGYRIEIKEGTKKGIGGTDFSVIIDKNHKQPHRHLHDINDIIEKSGLDEEVKTKSKNIFSLIAGAESKVHRVPVEEIHFHEIGAVDSIVDIVGSALCISNLGVDEVWSSPLNLGGGSVECGHGVLPVPAPATLEILKDVPVYSSGIKRELTTPTGGAVIRAFCTEFMDFPSMTIKKTGYGLGKADLDTPNVLRAVLGEEASFKTLVMLETSIDNMNPEIYSYLFPKLFEKGALDVFTAPIMMKKNRPAQKLSVLCTTEKTEELEGFLFKETPTLGIRRYPVARDEMERKQIKIETPYGEAVVKAAYMNGELIKFAPEYEDCARIAESSGKPIRQIYQEIMAIASGKLKD